MKSVTDLAHDLRDPLSTIMIWEQVLRATDDPSLREQALDAIRASVRVQAEIINELLAHKDFAR